MLGRRTRIQPEKVFLTLASLALFVISYFAVNRNVDSDPRLTLVVSQAFLDTGQVSLDIYREAQILGRSFAEHRAAGLIFKIGDHYFPYFPAGPSLLAAPFVWLARLAGADMLTEDNYTLQMILAGLSVIAVYLILYRITRYYLDAGPGLLIATVSVFGSTLFSTLGSAFWTLNLTTLFICLALWMLVREEVVGRMRPCLFGLTLFLAYVSRPTAVTFIIPAMTYLLWRSRRYFLQSAAVALPLLALYLGWSRITYGSFLPAYYAPSRLQVPRNPALIPLLGNLISPSRGVFVYSPFLVLVLAGLITGWRQVRRQPLLWMCAGWIGLHMALLARFGTWWGGSSFGPRLMTDLFPAFVLLSVYAWRANIPTMSPRARRLAVGAYATLGALAALLHAGQGMYHLASASWNLMVSPDPAAGWGDMFSWHFAQPLATNRMLCELQHVKYRAYLPRDDTLAPLLPGAEIGVAGDGYLPVYWLTDPPADSMADSGAPAAGLRPATYLPLLRYQGNQALFAGWAEPGGDFRWSVCHDSMLYFIPSGPPGNEPTAILSIVAGAHGSQDVELSLNGSPIGIMHWDQAPWEGAGEVRTLAFDSRLLRPGEINELAFHLPNAKPRPPDLSIRGLIWDQRLLGLAFESLAIDYAGELVAPANEATPESYP